MNPSDLDAVLAAVLADRRLLDHPFYRRWGAGDVDMAELSAYAAQYRHFEAALPGYLAKLEAGLPEGPARDAVAANRADELGDPVPHVELFDAFASAVGAAPEQPTAATGALIATYDELVASGAVSGLAGLLAYESQASEVAASKADGLRRHYGLDDAGVRFWEHHSAADARHGAWLRDAVAQQAEDSRATAVAARRAADAWWAFLDEREAARAA